MKCHRCGDAFTNKQPNLKYCDVCRAIVKAENKKKHAVEHAARRKARREIKKLSATPKTGTGAGKMTDVQQWALNRAIDDLHTEPCLSIHYLPGSAEFKRAAADIIDRRKRL